jgi:hypothetical protein
MPKDFISTSFDELPEDDFDLENRLLSPGELPEDFEGENPLRPRVLSE